MCDEMRFIVFHQKGDFHNKIQDSIAYGQNTRSEDTTFVSVIFV